MSKQTYSPTITVIEPTIKSIVPGTVEPNHKLRVAAYARVSTEQDEQQNSYEAQVSYYTYHIMSNPEWEFVGVYADEGISGISTKKRDGFNRMVADALDGKIDLILTKSISRFSRNTVDTLITVRKLREHGVEVRFEKEHISSFDHSSEMVFTVFCSTAQEESRSISENVRWGKQKSMEDGKVYMPYDSFLGYKKGKDGRPEVVPAEAKIVQEIYHLFLEGKTINYIAKLLTARGVKTPRGKDKWSVSTIRSILSNEKYRGDACLQKTFVVDYLTKKTKKNTGELKQYYIHNHHEAIIEPELFDLVQDELKKRSANQRKLSNNSPFTTKIICDDCGGFFGHKIQRQKQVWYCNHRYDDKNHTCETPIIPEESLKTYFAEALGAVLARVAATGSHKAPDPEEEAKQAEVLLFAQQAAKQALEAAIEELKQEHNSAKHDSDPESFQVRYDRIMQKVNDRKAALKLANADIIASTARKEKRRRFIEATTGLKPEDITYSDDLFVMTIEEIHVSKVKNWSYILEYTFTNGEKVTLKKRNV